MAAAGAIPAASNASSEGLSLARIGEFAIPIGVLGIVLALIVPLPTFVLDFLIVADIMLSVVVMMVAMYLTRLSIQQEAVLQSQARFSRRSLFDYLK